MRFATSDEPTADVGRHWDLLICSDGKYTWLCDCSELMFDESIQVWVNLDFYRGAHLSHSWSFLGFERMQQLFNQQSLNGTGYTIRINQMESRPASSHCANIAIGIKIHTAWLYYSFNKQFTFYFLLSNSVIFCYSSQSEAGITKRCDWIEPTWKTTSFLSASWMFF